MTNNTPARTLTRQQINTTQTIIKELDIREFRGIRKLAKPLKLGKFNILIGRNNVGKTAILEALYLFSMPYGRYPDPIYRKSRLDLLAELHGGKSSLIYGYAGTAQLKYKITKTKMRIPIKGIITPITTGDITIKITRTGIKELKIENTKVHSGSFKALLNALNTDPEKRPLCLYIPNNTNAYRKIRDYTLEDPTWSWIEKKGLHSKAIKELLTPTIYDKLTEALIRKNQLCVRKEIEKGIGPLYIDVDSLGEGIKRTLLAYLAIEHLNPKIILWDDIEVAAHPGLLETTLKWLTNTPRQVVITTHSIDVLHEITRIQPKECNIITLRKTTDDTINHRTIPPDQLEELLDKGIDIRKIIDILEL